MKGGSRPSPYFEAPELRVPALSVLPRYSMTAYDISRNDEPVLGLSQNLPIVGPRNSLSTPWCVLQGLGLVELRQLLHPMTTEARGGPQTTLHDSFA